MCRNQCCWNQNYIILVPAPAPAFPLILAQAPASAPALYCHRKYGNKFGSTTEKLNYKNNIIRNISPLRQKLFQFIYPGILQTDDIIVNLKYLFKNNFGSGAVEPEPKQLITAPALQNNVGFTGSATLVETDRFFKCYRYR